MSPDEVRQWEQDVTEPCTFPQPRSAEVAELRAEVKVVSAQREHYREWGQQWFELAKSATARAEAAEVRLRAVEELLWQGCGWLPSGIQVNLLEIADDMDSDGRPIFAKWLRLLSASTLPTDKGDGRA